MAVSMKQKHFIDSHKAATGPFILLLMGVHAVWDDPRLWLYFGMHGGYGLLWLLKSLSFPDKQWEQPTTLGFGAVIWGALSLYWLSPWLIVTGRAPTAPAWLMGVCVLIFTTGVFLHFASDMQKHMALRLRPGELLTEGLWSRLRNPNYLGELLIYGGFSGLTCHWLPLTVLAFFVVGAWVPNMIKKDRSLARYPAFAEWKARSWLFLPGI
jgi:steroid 5-alpha reductase family enzyme